MTPERRRSLFLLIGAALAFCAWIGWLSYLAVTASRPIVLSQPQFLVSQLDVTAELTGTAEHPEDTAQVMSVVYPRSQKELENNKIEVMNLPELTPADGWAGPGVYILPLQKLENGNYRVAPIPRSPGFSGRDHPRIYPATPQTLEQLRQIRAE
jgi:hypothetical protein